MTTAVGYWTGGITYGGVDLEFGVTDANGVRWTWCGLDGWDGVPTAGTVVQRGGDHGGWASPQFSSPRPLTLRVSADAPSQAARDAARAQIQAVVPISDLAVLRYDEPIPKQVKVRRSGVLAEVCPNLTAVDFTIGLVAPDPRKYATTPRVVRINAPNTVSLLGITPPLTPPLALPAQAPAGSIFVGNAGSFETRPTFTITGSITSPSVTNATTGQRITWTNLVLGPGDVLAADTDLRQGLVNGSFRPADATSAWWVNPPGGSTLILGGVSDGSSQLTVISADAYI